MKVSIITVAFNSAATIAHCMQSVLDQSYSNIEYIVVDGLSKDNTLNIVREFEPLFAGKMRWISENDNGIYDAMNKGLHMATGDVVGILNSDDFFTDNDVIEKVARPLQMIKSMLFMAMYILCAKPTFLDVLDIILRLVFALGGFVLALCRLILHSMLAKKCFKRLDFTKPTIK